MQKLDPPPAKALLANTDARFENCEVAACAGNQTPPAVMNFFEHPSAVQRYAAARPFFHPIVREMIVPRLGDPKPLGRAIDVACGTGLSTRILVGLAEEIVGVDVSSAMLAAAGQADGIRYLEAKAESLPFPDAHFDLMTVALAFHWFERDRFLAEARRVLRPGGHLVIYNHGFHGEMAGVPGFATWARESYAARYPTPSRDRRPFGVDEAAAAGFALKDALKFAHFWPFTVEELAAYLMTQSNVIAAVENGTEDLTDVQTWLETQVRPMFSLPHEVFRFTGSVQFLTRSGGGEGMIKR